MRDVLSTIVRQTSGLIEVIKITGTPTETKLQGVDDNKTLFIEGTLKAPIPEFEGEFGLTNLSLLKGLLDFSSYRTDQATFTVKRREWQGSTTVEQFQFRDANGAGADFRCMSPDRVPEQAEIRNIPWDVTIAPNKSKVSEFEQLARLYSEVDKSFGVKTDGKGNLLFFVGDESSSTHRASMVFESGITGEIKGGLTWSTSQFLQVLKLVGSNEYKLKITSRGIISIEVENDFGTFKYYLRASR